MKEKKLLNYKLDQKSFLLSLSEQPMSGPFPHTLGQSELWGGSDRDHTSDASGVRWMDTGYGIWRVRANSIPNIIRQKSLSVVAAYEAIGVLDIQA